MLIFVPGEKRQWKRVEFLDRDLTEVRQVIKKEEEDA